MRRDLLLLSALAISLVTLATSDDKTAKPCRIQSEENQLRCVIPSGYKVRSGDCPGNDILSLHRQSTTLTECARLCSSAPKCQAFMFTNNHSCYPKTKTCGTTTDNLHHAFYDKVPSGYRMQQRDNSCYQYDIWGLERDGVTRQECAQLCDSSSQCNTFLHYDNQRCRPKYKACQSRWPDYLASPLNIFYDKVPRGYSVRVGDCPGNDLWIFDRSIDLSLCARLCDDDPNCVSFMYSDGKECFPKIATCAQPSIDYDKAQMFYDKVPDGYAMRPGNCPGNDMELPMDAVTSLDDCAQRCNDYSPDCVSFMFKDSRECFPKTKTCQTTDTADPAHVFYDKIITI